MGSRILQNPRVQNEGMKYMNSKSGGTPSFGGPSKSPPYSKTPPPIINKKQMNQQTPGPNNPMNSKTQAPNITVNVKSAAPVPYASPPPTYTRRKTVTNTSKIVIAVIGVLVIVGLVLLLIFLDCNDIASYRSTGESSGDCCPGDCYNNLCDGCTDCNPS